MDAGDLNRELQEGWNTDDLERVFAAFHPDIVVRPDPHFPDSAPAVGHAQAQRFWHDNRDTLGGRFEMLESDVRGDLGLFRARQYVSAAASGIKSFYDWSYILRGKDDLVVEIEFHIDRESGIERFREITGGD